MRVPRVYVQPLFVDRGIGHVLYADDLQIYVQVPSIQFEEGTDKLAIAAKDFSEWAARFGLRLNPSKTQVLCLDIWLLIYKGLTLR